MVDPNSPRCTHCWNPTGVVQAHARLPARGIHRVPNLWGLTAAFLLLALVVGNVALAATDLALLSGGVTVIAVAVWEDAREPGRRR